MTTGLAIEVSGLSHRYPHARAGRAWALKDVALSVPAGQVFALLGPNGAGKTTLVKILSTLLLPTSGTVRVDGRDAVRETKHVRSRLGLVLGGDRGLYDRLSARDNLRYFAALYGMRRGPGRARVDEVLEIVGLGDEGDKRVEQFSRGMRQRLHLARGILHRPAVLLLDEPTIGVDPVGARRLRSLIQSLNDQGTSILLTTHYMHEAEQLARDVAIIRDGRIVVRGTPKQVLQRAKVQSVVEALADGVAAETVASIADWPSVAGVDVYEYQGRQRLLIGLAVDGVDAEAVTDRLEGLGVQMTARRAATLEDAYVEFVSGKREE